MHADLTCGFQFMDSKRTLLSRSTNKEVSLTKRGRQLSYLISHWVFRAKSLALSASILTHDLETRIILSTFLPWNGWMPFFSRIIKAAVEVIQM